MANLEEIRRRIAAQENKNQDRGTSPQESPIYPHWNMDDGTTATVRYLPDNDPNNPFFWTERQIIKLPFNGVKNNPDHRGQVIVQVPCMEMYQKQCPVLTEVRPWYNDASLKDTASTYWKKRSYIYQGFVRANPIGNDVSPANPIRRFVISPSIQTLIKASLMDPELDELPTDYIRGLDFNIKKTTKGGYADYSTSTWARKESPLTEAELEAIAEHGLFTLSEFLPKEPTEAEVKIIAEMFEASVDGDAYDLERFGNYFRPYGMEKPGDQKNSQKTLVSMSGKSTDDLPAIPFTPTNNTKSTTNFVEAVAQQETNVTSDVPAAEGSSEKKTNDILAMIRQRQGK